MFINQKIHIFGEFWRSCQSDLQIGNGLLPLAALVWFMIITRTYYLFPDIISRSFEGPVFAGSVGPDGWPWVRAVTSHAAALPTWALAEQTSSNNQPQSAYTDIFYANVDFRSDAATQTWHFENQNAFEPVDRWQREVLHRQIHYFRGRADRSQYV